MDLSKFFDRVQHDVLMSRVARKVRDRRLLKLIGRYLRAGVMVEGVLQSSPEGTPQGGPLSPLLANILLDDLDKDLERRGLPFVRYADDFVIFTKTRRAAERVFRGVNRYLTCAPTTPNLDGPDSLAGGPCSSRFKGGWLWHGRWISGSVRSGSNG